MCIRVYVCVWLRESVYTIVWLQLVAICILLNITICVCVCAFTRVSAHAVLSVRESTCMECADKEGWLYVDMPRLRIPLLCAHRIASHLPIAC